MELNEYQKKAMSTCMASCDNFSYMFINLVGEVGEFASKVGKQIRKKHYSIGETDTSECNDLGIDADYAAANTEEATKVHEELKKEAGDVLWQLSGLCKVMGWTLEEVAQMNLDKLAARKAIGTIDGSGDGIERGK